MSDVADWGAEGDDRQWLEAITRTVGDGVYQLDREGQFVRVDRTIAEMTGYDREDLLGESASLVLTEESYRQTEEVIRELLASDEDVATQEMTVVTADGEHRPVENRLALLWDDGEFRGSAGIVRDVSDRKRRERQLQEQRDELVRINRINGIIRDTIRTLVSASGRQDITAQVCERLAASQAYLAAWVGDYGPSGGVRPVTWAGVDEATVEAHLEATAGGDGGGVPGAPFRTGTVAVAEVPADDPLAAVTDDGALTVAAIPLVYGGTVYSVLYVYTDRETGIGDREVEVLQELGETIGLAMNALETQRLLYADTTTELEFEFDDPDVLGVEVSERLGCTIRLEGVVRGSDEELLVYLSVEGAAPDRFVEEIADHPSVTDAAVVTADGGALVLLTVTGRTPVRAFREAGGRIESAVVEEGSGRLVGAVASETDSREMVELFQRSFPGARLVAQREVERPVETRREFRQQVRDALTDKQRRALEAAYFAHYFERPRPVTGTELADSLDVSPSTFHQHLQAGLGKVLGAVFDPRDRQ